MSLRKKTALKDIAKEVGVSTALVSYVLNGKHTDRIHPETARRIREVADEINYQPNQIALSLKNRKTYTIGLIVADISNLFYSGIARVIEDEAKKHKYNVIFGSADEKLDKFEELVQVFVNRQVDGIILAAPEDAEERLNLLVSQHVPFVMIDRYFPGTKDFNSVTINNYKASSEVAYHLLDKGVRRPAMITLATNMYHLQERANGFKDVIEAKLGAGKAAVISLQEETLGNTIGQVIKQLLNDEVGIDALYFSTNKIALEGLGVLANYGVLVPEQVAVVCFDEADAYKLFKTSVTFVKQPLNLIGKEAVELLLAQISGDLEPRSIVLDTIIVEGNSSAKTNKVG